jgi:protein Mpv17
MLLRLLARAASAYGAALVARPVVTKSATAAVIAAAGDLTCQALLRAAAPPRSPPPLGAVVVVAADTDEGEPPTAPHSRWDAARTARMTLWALAVTPLVHKWFGWLGRAFPSSPLQRMLADQLLFTPINIVAFLFTMGVAETGCVGGGMQKLHAVLPDVLRTSYTVWPAATWLTFRFVPPPLQLLAVNCVGFVWAIFLSSAVNRGGGGSGGGGGGGGGGDAVSRVARQQETAAAAAESQRVKAAAASAESTLPPDLYGRQPDSTCTSLPPDLYVAARHDAGNGSRHRPVRAPTAARPQLPRAHAPLHPT